MSLNQPFDDIYDDLPDIDHESERQAAYELEEVVGSIGSGSTMSKMATGITFAAAVCHGLAKRAGWWNDPVTGEPVERNDGELIALMHSELSEALEALRKDRNDDHLPHRKGVEVELADVLVRIFDYAGARKLDLAGAMIEKLAYNARRADHTPAARAQADGKKF